ncbi:MAG: SOS response-associated peptidase, partial [Mesorhizobium sp.]
VENRCVVPLTSFAEPSPTPGDKDPDTGIQKNYWFALNEERPLFFFAGLWTRWQGVRKVKDGPGDFELYGFLTTKPNALIAPIHEKAMPVILTTQEETETWLTAPWSEARHLQRTAPD